MQQFLMRPVDAASLAAFRILFGGIMVMESINLGTKIAQRYSPEMFHFSYPGFGWVAPLPGYGMHAVFVVMGAAAFALAIGLFYRLAAAVFLILYSYVFLIEHTTYNNHYYLIILLSLLFLVTDAHREASADGYRRTSLDTGWVPRWQLYIFRIQMALVYFYGGIAKLNGDWLQRQPIDHWLHKRSETHALGWVLDSEPVSYLFAYGGLAFDLFIGPLLLWRKTRPIAVVMVVAFHLTNSYVFTIGVFPWLGIAATVLFFEPRTVRRMLNWFGHAPMQRETPVVSAAGMKAQWAMAFFVVYVFIQIVLPLRHWAYPGNVHWTEEGHLFAWHMKLRGKSSECMFHVRSGTESIVFDHDDLREALTEKQIVNMGTRPRLAAQYARHLRKRYEAQGHTNVQVIAEVIASLNGRPYQLIIDPQVDLSRVDTNPFKPAQWIMPLDSGAQPGLFPPPPSQARVPEEVVEE